MSVYAQNQNYKDVLNAPGSEGGISIPIFCPDFKTMQFTMAVLGYIVIDDLVGEINVGDQISGDSSDASATIASIAVLSAIDGTYIVGLTDITGAFEEEDITGPEGTATITDITYVAPNITVTAYMSNASDTDEIPNLSNPSSPDNQYSQVGYTDEATQEFWNTSNPVTIILASTRTFNVETTGARYIWIKVTGAPDIDDLVLYPRCDVQLFSHT